MLLCSFCDSSACLSAVLPTYLPSLPTLQVQGCQGVSPQHLLCILHGCYLSRSPVIITLWKCLHIPDKGDSFPFLSVPMLTVLHPLILFPHVILRSIAVDAKTLSLSALPLCGKAVRHLFVFLPAYCGFHFMRSLKLVGICTSEK